MDFPLEVGLKISVPYGDGRAVGEVDAPAENDQLSVRVFAGCGQSELLRVPISDAELASLGLEQRVYVDAGDHWRIGRLISEVQPELRALRRFFVRFPEQDGHALNENQFHVPGGVAEADPIDTLIHYGHETPYFFDCRSQLVQSLARQRAACGGLTGVASAKMELFPHQLDVAHRALTDVRQRFLLADDAGLGKTVLSCAVLNQLRIDQPQASALILAPRMELLKWRDELARRLLLDVDEEPKVEAVEFSSAGEIAAAPNLLIVDQPHQLLRGEGQEIRDQVKRLAETSGRLLLLAGGSELTGQEMATLQSWLEAESQPRSGAASPMTTLRSGGADALLPPRSVPSLEYEVYPDVKQELWSALENWRSCVAHSLKTNGSDDVVSAMTVVFRTLLQGICSWSTWCEALVLARLGEAPDMPPGRDELAAMQSAPLLPGENDALERLIESLKKDRHFDRIKLLVEALRRDAFSGKTVVFTTDAPVCREIAARMRELLGGAVAECHRGQPFEERESQFRSFRGDASCKILVCDRSGEQLRFPFAERLIHFDLPLDPTAVERRVQSFEFLSRTPRQIASTAILCDSEGHGYDEAWWSLLKDGFGVFRSPLADVHLRAETLAAKLCRAALLEGIDAWRGQADSIAEKIAQARQEIPPDEPSAQASTLFDRMSEYEQDAQSFGAAVQTYLKGMNKINVERLRSRKSKQIDYYTANDVLLPKDWYDQILPDLLRPGDVDRAEAMRHGDHALLRLGHPLIDKIDRFTRHEDRGKTYVMWRTLPGCGMTRTLFRLQYAVEADEAPLRQAVEQLDLPGHARQGLVRLADSFLPPDVHELFVDSSGMVITDSAVVSLLARPYRKSSGDRSLAKERVAVLHNLHSRQQWQSICESIRENASDYLMSQGGFANILQQSSETVRDEFTRRHRQVEAALSQAPAERRSQRLAEEKAIGDAMLQAVSKPRVRLDAAGVLILSEQPCPTTEDE